MMFWWRSIQTELPISGPDLAASLAGMANDVAKARGYLLGKDAAAAILTLWFSMAPGIKATQSSAVVQ